MQSRPIRRPAARLPRIILLPANRLSRLPAPDGFEPDFGALASDDQQHPPQQDGLPAHLRRLLHPPRDHRRRLLPIPAGPAPPAALRGNALPLPPQPPPAPWAFHSPLTQSSVSVCGSAGISSPVSFSRSSSPSTPPPRGESPPVSSRCFPSPSASLRYTAMQVVLWREFHPR